jgi:PAS domain S-box-containing protein
MVVFGIVLSIIALSAVFTNLQVAQLGSQQDAAQAIQSEAGRFNQISTDYFLKQQDAQLTQWQEEFDSLSNDVTSLRPANSEQQALLDKISGDIQQLNPAFNDVVAYLQNAPRNLSVRILPQFQAIWGNLSEQNQALSFDSALLSQVMGNQSDQLKTEDSIIIIALLCAVGGYFVTNYFVVYRRAMKSISKLQAGTKIIGSGNLDYSIETVDQNEVGELSISFNQMTNSLKNLTISKKQLEDEVQERKKIEGQLEASKMQLEKERNLLQAIMNEPKNMHLVYLDRDFNFLRVNEAYAKTCGYRPEEMIGKNHFDLYPSEENEVIFARARDKGETASFHDKPFLFPDQPQRGVTYWDWTLSPIKNNSGNVEGLVFALVETTERKRAEEESHQALEEAKLRQAEMSALLTAAKTVLFNRGFESSSRVIFDSCKELLGATSGYVALLSDNGKDNIVLFLESGGLPCNVDPSLPMPIRGLRAVTYNTGKVTFENNFPNSEWTRFLPKGHVDLKNVLFSPLKIEGKTVGIMGLANKPGGFTEHDAQIGLAFGDIASIALINSNMIDMLEENQKKLTAYSENLETLVQEKTKMLQDSERLAAIGATAGMVGHDIRNPLQAIIGDVYLLRSELSSLPEGEEKESMKESLDGMDENVQYVNKIVQDLQDYAKPINPMAQETNVQSLLEDALFKNGVPDKVDVSCQVEKKAKRLVTDPGVLKRIISNLVSNAFQAMPNGGKLTVHVFREAESTVITVMDTGVGIPEEVKPKLFSPLFTTKSKGQGFGLAVVKRMTEALGGTVNFESEVGKGTKFILHLPTQKNER